MNRPNLNEAEYRTYDEAYLRGILDLYELRLKNREVELHDRGARAAGGRRELQWPSLKWLDRFLPHNFRLDSTEELSRESTYYREQIALIKNEFTRRRNGFHE